MVTADDSQVVDAVSDMIWHIHVPVNVSIFAWSLLRKRLPTKANLVARGIISQEAQMCVTGWGEVESANHLFFTCSIFGKLLSLLHDWIGVSGADPFDGVDHFLQFSFLVAGSATKRSIIQLLWFLCVWVL